ncbi:hypothetical protein OAV36_03745 [Flavobacteriales bacterium]|nr:hypothetical protein [Flavobacteriales bacterium]
MKNNYEQIFGVSQRSGMFTVIVNGLLLFSAGYLVSRFFIMPSNNSNSNRNNQLLEIVKVKGDIVIESKDAMLKMVKEEIRKSIDAEKKKVKEDLVHVDFKVEKDVVKSL